MNWYVVIPQDGTTQLVITNAQIASKFTRSLYSSIQMFECIIRPLQAIVCPLCGVQFQWETRDN